MSFKTIVEAIVAFFKAIFGGNKSTPTVQQTPTVTRPVYKYLTVTNEGVPTTGAVKGISIEKLEFITTLEKRPEVKAEIMKLTCNKEDERVNEYQFETETGRYNVYSGQIQRYPKV